MSLYNDDVNLNDIGDDDVVTETPQNEITDESTNPPIVIDNPIEYDEIDFDDDNFQGGGGESIPVIEPPIELDPVGYANMVSKTFSTRLVITDYSQSFLEDLYNQGAEFHAVYLDGYDEVISWQEIVDPYTSTTETASSEILSLTEAIGQHFWIGDDGIHVTEAEEKDYIANHYGHSMLINSYGLLMRNNECNLVGITQSAITFYDGTGNESTDITALFGPTTIIGRENKAHVQINFQGFDIYNKNEDAIATIKTLNDTDGNLTATVLCHLTKQMFNNGSSSIRLGLADTGYRATSIISIRTNEDPSTIITDDPIVFSNSETSNNGPVYDIVFGQNDSRYSLLEPYIDQDVRVTLLTTNLYNEYSFGIRNPNYQAGLNSFVVGETNSATGLASFSHGMNNEALGSYAHSEGYDTNASGIGSHTEGYQTIAQAGHYGISAYNHAEGFQTKARALASHAEGLRSEVTPQGEYSHAEGIDTIVGEKKDLLQDKIQAALDSNYPIATYPNRNYEDRSTETTISFSIYKDNTKTNGIGYYYNYRYSYTGIGAHAEGYKTEAKADYSHSEGYETRSEGQGSHAEGYGSISSGLYAHATGRSTEAIGDNSHTQNLGTIAASVNQTVLGTYNISDPEGRYATIIGNGYSTSDRRNALGIRWDGAVEIGPQTFGNNETSPSGVIIKSLNAVGSQTDAPSSTIWGNLLTAVDKDNQVRSYIRHVSNADGRHGIQLETKRLKSDGTNAYNGIIMYVAADGTQSVYVSNAAAWRTAIGATPSGIGAVAKSGDTMTGNLTAPRYIIHNTDYDLKKANNGGTARYPGIELFDKNNLSPAFIGAGATTDGLVHAGVWVRNYDTSGNRKTNSEFSIRAAKDGTISYSVPNGAAFRSAIGAQASGSYAAKSWTGLGTCTGTGSKSYDLTNYTEVLVAAKFAGKLVTTVLPKALLTTSNQELWIGGGKSAGTTANGGCARAVVNITTTKLTGVSSNNAATDTTSSTTWYIYAR